MSISNKTMMTETRELTLKIIDKINRLRVESRGDWKREHNKE